MASVSDSELYTLNKGIPFPPDALVVLVKTEWNKAIVDSLEEGCKRILDQYKISHKTFIVPGAVEIPFAVKSIVEHMKKVVAVISLGCVIKGDTPHFDYVCQSVTTGITELNLRLSIPVIFGVLTVNTTEQALERIGGVHGHKGEEAALTALKMVHLQQQLKEGKA